MASVTFLLLAFSCVSHLIFVYATDSSPLQDFCVADLQSPVIVNGFVCKDPKDVAAADFFFTGLRKPGNTNNQVGSAVTAATVLEFPGLNTLGISMVRIDYAPGGQNPPHTHPRATEILIVLQGKILVGFVTSNPNNTFFSVILEKGDVFVFPRGLIHFQQNIGEEPALAIAALSSQNPGVITIANAVFGANPPISDFVLAKAFMITKKMVAALQAKFFAG